MRILPQVTQSTFLRLLAAILTIAPLTAYAKETAPSAGTKDAIEVSPQQQSSREEVAAIQVLSEICPQIIGQNKNFNSGYQILLGDFLPGFSDPELALKALNENEDYQKALLQAREDAKNATREDNREICLGVIEWNQYAKTK